MLLDRNHAKYESAVVVAFYENEFELQPCEAHLFSRHIAPGRHLLDIGVGAGRTTPYLSAAAARYVGVDYAKSMIDVCRRRYPDLEFRHGDATALVDFDDASFDVVVFSFNGIDVIGSDEGRARCLAEVARVLKPGGMFVFSSHNARVLAFVPNLSDVSGRGFLKRILRAVYETVTIAGRLIFSGSYVKGEGYIKDPAHGGMDHYVSTPEAMKRQLKAVDMDIVEVVGSRHPETAPAFLTPWYYYACRKGTPRTERRGEA